MTAKKAAPKKATPKADDKPEPTGVATFDNRNAYGVMEAATESARPALRADERRSARGIRRR